MEKRKLKKILCFGDSNTWGYIPDSGLRYDENTRWTGILGNLLKNKFEITEAGCCNRTCFIDNPDGIEQTGYKVLPKYLDGSFDIVILSLGINDLQLCFNPNLSEVKAGVKRLVDLAKQICPKSKIVLISPARLGSTVRTEYFKNQFDSAAIEKSKHLASIYADIAKSAECLFFDWDKIVKVSNADGLHLTSKSHKKIAYALYDFLFCNEF